MSLPDSLPWQLTQLSGKAKKPLLLIVNHHRELDRLHQTALPKLTARTKADSSTLRSVLSISAL